MDTGIPLIIITALVLGSMVACNDSNNHAAIKKLELKYQNQKLDCNQKSDTNQEKE